MGKVLIKSIGKSINAAGILSPKYAAKLAVKLFSTPQEGKLSRQAANYLETASQKDIPQNDFLIKTYHWKGNKENVLLVHGWESNTYRWKDLIEVLKALHFNIFALDAPAHGASGSKTFNAILYSESINQLVKTFSIDYVIGHSIGGSASAFAIHTYKLPVKKMVMLGSPSNYINIVGEYKAIMGYSTAVKKAIDQYFTDVFGQPLAFYSIENFSEEIKARTLVVHDKQDKIIPFRDALEIDDSIANTKFVETKGLGHGLRSDTVYSVITSFLNT
ncbi:MAG: alpha/beta fold hydrolase [Aestuariibaculum sp.]